MGGFFVCLFINFTLLEGAFVSLPIQNWIHAKYELCDTPVLHRDYIFLHIHNSVLVWFVVHSNQHLGYWSFFYFNHFDGYIRFLSLVLTLIFLKKSTSPVCLLNIFLRKNLFYIVFKFFLEFITALIFSNCLSFYEFYLLSLAVLWRSWGAPTGDSWPTEPVIQHEDLKM